MKEPEGRRAATSVSAKPRRPGRSHLAPSRASSRTHVPRHAAPGRAHRRALPEDHSAPAGQALFGSSRAAMSAQRRRRLRRTVGVVSAVVGLLLAVLVGRPIVDSFSTGTQSVSSAAGPVGPVAGESQPAAPAPAASAAASGMAGPGAPGPAGPAPMTPAPPIGDGAGPVGAAVGGAAAVVAKGSGTFSVLQVAGRDNRSGGREIRFTVEVEGGLESDAAEFTETVASVLRGPRGWEQADHVHFSAVSPQRSSNGIGVAVRVTLASPQSVDRLCYPLDTRGEVSCFANGRAVINQRRWHTGAPSYGADLASYREYLINHEVGHALGHGHEDCPTKGAKAPIMLQQTLGLQGCHAWPYPVTTG